MTANASRLVPLAALILAGVAAGPVRAQCAEEPQFQNYSGGGSVVCPCFVAGEQAGAVFDLPAAHYPVEILRVGIGWGSQFGGNPQQIEEAIHVYDGGLPNPGAPIFTLPGPQMTDGAINVFNLEPLPGEIVVTDGPATVTLEFLNDSSFFAPSVVHDGNGCQPGKNVVRLESGSWADACTLGVSGDWVFFVVYRRLGCGGVAGAVPDGGGVPGTPLLIGRGPGGDLELDWDDSCAPTDIDYHVYQGTLGSWDGHTALLCTTGGLTSATVTPAAASSYYLVVPTDGDAEGSYGTASDESERPAAADACVEQVTGACR